jgi:hypothetical protein
MDSVDSHLCFFRSLCPFGLLPQPTAQRRASIWNTAGIGGELFADYRYIFGTGPALLATSNIVILYNTLYQQFFLNIPAARKYIIF